MKKKRERKNPPPQNQAMLNTFAHYILTDAQPLPKLLFWPTSHSLNTGHDVARYGMPLWPVWVSCPNHVSSQVLVHLLAGKA